MATSIDIDPAAAAASEETAKANVAHLNTVEIPRESMNDPAMAVVTPDASRKAVMTHGEQMHLAELGGEIGEGGGDGQTLEGDDGDGREDCDRCRKQLAGEDRPGDRH